VHFDNYLSRTQKLENGRQRYRHACLQYSTHSKLSPIKGHVLETGRVISRSKLNPKKVKSTCLLNGHDPISRYYCAFSHQVALYGITGEKEKGIAHSTTGIDSAAGLLDYMFSV
jgi:hypothetical protein